MACKEEEKEVLQRSKSIEDCCSSKTSSKKNQDDDHAKPQKSGFDQKLSELLLTFHNLPLIPNETALNLLKIQSSKSNFQMR